MSSTKDDKVRKYKQVARGYQRRLRASREANESLKKEYEKKLREMKTSKLFFEKCQAMMRNIQEDDATDLVTNMTTEFPISDDDIEEETAEPVTEKKEEDEVSENPFVSE
jgi:hypothetical protein